MNAKIRTGTSKFKGVTYLKNKNRWWARIVVDYKIISLKTYATEIEAAIVYNEAARKYFGEFAKINDIPETLAL